MSRPQEIARLGLGVAERGWTLGNEGASPRPADFVLETRLGCGETSTVSRTQRLRHGCSRPWAAF